MKVLVAGAGIVGLTCAWSLTEAGHDVTVFDPSPGQGASYAAAGMVAPASEMWFGEVALLRLGLASARLWPDLAGHLGIDYHRSGTVLAGRDAGDLVALRRHCDLLRSLGIPVSDGADASLSDRTVVAGCVPHEGHLDPRAATTALLDLLGDRVVRAAAPPSYPEGWLIRCTGTAAHPGVRPERGEIIRVRTEDGPERMVRGLVHGQPVYLVPRPGELVIGATAESHDAPPVPTVGGVLRLLDAARSLVPALDRAEILEVLARDRPRTPDNGPLIGRTGERTVLAAGHYRSGVLLAPITAAAVLALVSGDDPPPEIAPFHPSRFTEEATPA